MDDGFSLHEEIEELSRGATYVGEFKEIMEETAGFDVVNDNKDKAFLTIKSKSSGKEYKISHTSFEHYLKNST
jgi:hypothetical protein